MRQENQALWAWPKPLPKKWVRYKFTVMRVAFGCIESRLTEATEEKKMIQIEWQEIPVGMPVQNAAAIQTMVLMGRGGTPREAAGAVWLFYLLQSDYIPALR